MALLEIKSKVSFDLILKSDEPNFIILKRDWGLPELVKPVMAITESFLRSAFPDQSEMATDAAIAMIEREPTWTLLDTVNFFKTIINRQDLEAFKVFGNKITLLRLMEMVGEYEGLKADERERLWNEKKGEYSRPAERYASDSSMKALMGKELERIQIRDNDVSVKYPTPPDENYFKRNPLNDKNDGTLSSERK